MSGLKGKVILITGASSGIGAGTAVQFAKLGCKLSLIARNSRKLNEVSEKCLASGANQVFVSSHDVGKTEECVRAVTNTLEKYKGKTSLS